MTVEFKDEVQEDAVIPLAALLETPNEPELSEEELAEQARVTAEADAAKELEKAETKVEDKIEEAKLEGASKEEISELRGLLRELRNDNISLRTRLEAAEKVQKGDFGTEGKATEDSDLVKYSNILKEVSARDFSEITAVMEVNPKYEDLAEVCSGRHFADIFENVATYRSENGGVDFNTELVKVKAEIWSMPNPYKYMYDTIKEYHPDYAAKKTDKTETPAAKDVIKEKPVVKAPASVASLGTGDETKSGWTAEKIDNLPEGKLHTVPKEVYKKWLAGELD